MRVNHDAMAIHTRQDKISQNHNPQPEDLALGSINSDCQEDDDDKKRRRDQQPLTHHQESVVNNLDISHTCEDCERGRSDDKNRHRNKDIHMNTTMDIIPCCAEAASSLPPPAQEISLASLAHTATVEIRSASPAATKTESIETDPVLSLSTLPPIHPAQPQFETDGNHRGEDPTNPQAGLDLWHTWLAQQADKHGPDNSCITPSILLQYLDTVIIPKKLGSTPGLAASMSIERSSINQGSLIQVYLRPVLQLWHQQEKEKVQTPGNYDHDPLKTSSRTASPLDIQFGHHVATTQRQQDHHQRLAFLEHSHRDTALLVSRLNDQVRYIVRDKEHRAGKGMEPPFSNLSANGITEKDPGRHPSHASGEEEEHADIVMSASPSQTLHPEQPQRHLHCDNDEHCCRATDKLIAAIAKGLEEYHANRSAHRCHSQHHHRHQASEQSPPCRHHNSITTFVQEQEQRFKAAAAVHRPSDGHPHSHLERSHHLDDHLHNSEQTAYKATAGLSQRHAGFQQDFLTVEQQQRRHHERPGHRHKRSSSMSGHEPLARENVKQARSCSPLRVRKNMDTAVEDGYLTMTAGHATDGEDAHASSRQSSSASALPVPFSYSKAYNNMDGTVPETLSHSKDTRTTGHAHGMVIEEPRCDTDQPIQPSRSSRNHKYSHTTQLSRSLPNVEMEFTPYDHQQYHQHRHHHQQPQHHQQHQQHEQQQRLYHNPEENSYSPHTGDHPHPSFTQAPTSPTRPSSCGRHTKNQGSFSSHYSTLQHHYQRNDSRTYHGYDQYQQHHHHPNHPNHHHHHHQQPPPPQQQFHPTQFPEYMDYQEEDIKSSHHLQVLKNNHKQGPTTPVYVMNRQVNTVPELWKEWTVGLGPGNPSIRELERQYGPSWRTSSSAANFFSRRLRIINEIQRMIDVEGLTEEEAVNKLEARREQGVVVPGTEGVTGIDGQPAHTGGISLHRLSEILRKKQS